MAQEPDTNEGYEALRVPIDRRVDLRLDPEGEWTRATAANISMSGLFIQTPAKVEPGAVFEVRLELQEGEPIRGRASVLWCRERDAGPDRPRGIGARFLDLDLESKYAISCLVERYAQLGRMPFQLAARAADETPVAASSLNRRGVLALALAFTAGLAIGWAGSLWLERPFSSVLRATDRSVSGARMHRTETTDAASASARDTVEAWARAWSQKDVDHYLGFYSEDFEPASGQALDDWKAERRERLGRQGFIEVEVSGVAIEAVAEGRVIARFDQTYASPGYRDRVRKALELALEEPGWRVVREEVLAGSPSEPVR